MFYFYQNWQAHGKTIKFHEAECKFCNHGTGLLGHPDPKHACWQGPFTTVKEAEISAEGIGKGVYSISSCKKCLKNNQPESSL